MSKEDKASESDGDRSGEGSTIDKFSDSLKKLGDGHSNAIGEFSNKKHTVHVSPMKNPLEHNGVSHH